MKTVKIVRHRTPHCPAWLDSARKTFEMPDEKILRRLLSLNLVRTD